MATCRLDRFVASCRLLIPMATCRLWQVVAYGKLSLYDLVLVGDVYKIHTDSGISKLMLNEFDDHLRIGANARSSKKSFLNHTREHCSNMSSMHRSSKNVTQKLRVRLHQNFPWPTIASSNMNQSLILHSWSLSQNQFYPQLPVYLRRRSQQLVEKDW